MFDSSPRRSGFGIDVCCFFAVSCSHSALSLSRVDVDRDVDVRVLPYESVKNNTNLWLRSLNILSYVATTSEAMYRLLDPIQMCMLSACVRRK